MCLSALLKAKPFSHSSVLMPLKAPKLLSAGCRSQCWLHAGNAHFRHYLVGGRRCARWTVVFQLDWANWFPCFGCCWSTPAPSCRPALSLSASQGWVAAGVQISEVGVTIWIVEVWALEAVLHYWGQFVAQLFSFKVIKPGAILPQVLVGSWKAASKHVLVHCLTSAVMLALG